MKILTLSDLCWERKLQKIKNEEVKRFKERDLEKEKYSGIKKYFSLIKEEKPDLILFAGDITGDGSCGHGYQNAMKILLKILEANEIQSFFISGNHDEFDYFNELINFSNDLQFSKEISNQFIEFKGIKILGISFDKSKNKTEFKELIKANNQKVDIVLSHAELKRRIWLFDLNTDFVITGHFDKKLTSVEGKIFVSLDNDTSNISYCTLTFDDDTDVKIRYVLKKRDEIIEFTESSRNLRLNKPNGYFTNNGERKEISIEEKKLSIREILEKQKEGELLEKLMEENTDRNEDLKYLRGFDFKEAIERIRKVKNENKLLSDNEFDNLLRLKIDSFYQISKSMIIDYTGKNYKKKNGVEQSAKRQ
jgi:predicted phosphodiesterase